MLVFEVFLCCKQTIMKDYDFFLRMANEIFGFGYCFLEIFMYLCKVL